MPADMLLNETGFPPDQWMGNTTLTPEVESRGIEITLDTRRGPLPFLDPNKIAIIYFTSVKIASLTAETNIPVVDRGAITTTDAAGVLRYLWIPTGSQTGGVSFALILCLNGDQSTPLYQQITKMNNGNATSEIAITVDGMNPNQEMKQTEDGNASYTWGPIIDFNGTRTLVASSGSKLNLSGIPAAGSSNEGYHYFLFEAHNVKWGPDSTGPIMCSFTKTSQRKVFNLTTVTS